MVKFIDLDISQLHKIIRVYKLETQIIPPKKKISQLSKAELVAEIEKHLELKEDKIYFKHNTNNFAIPKASKPRPVNPNAPERPKKPTKSEIIEQLMKRVEELEKIIEDLSKGKPEIIKETRYSPPERTQPKPREKKEKKEPKYRRQGKPNVEITTSLSPSELENKIKQIENKNKIIENKIIENEKLINNEFHKIEEEKEALGAKMRKAADDKDEKLTKKLGNDFYALHSKGLAQMRITSEYKKEIKLNNKEIASIKLQIKSIKAQPTQQTKAEKFEPIIKFEKIRKYLYSQAKKSNNNIYVELLKDKKVMKELKKIYEGGNLNEILNASINTYKSTKDPLIKDKSLKMSGLLTLFKAGYDKKNKSKTGEIIVEF